MDFRIQNIVGSADVKFPIRLEKLVLSHSSFSRFVAFLLIEDFSCGRIEWIVVQL